MIDRGLWQRGLRSTETRTSLPRQIDLIPSGAVAAVYLIGICVAERLTSSVDAGVGVAAHVALFFALLWHGATTRNVRLRALLWAVALAPLLRLLSLAMPLSDISTIGWFAIVSVPVLAASVVAARTLGYTRHELGLVVRWRDLPLTLVLVPIGVGIGLVEYLLLQPAPLASNLSLREVLVPALVLTVCTGFVEEFLFRGVMQRAALGVLGPARGLTYVSVIFAALHLGYHSAADVAVVFLTGWLFAWTTWWSRSLVAVTFAHAAVNVSMFLVWPFLLPPVLRLTGG